MVTFEHLPESFWQIQLGSIEETTDKYFWKTKQVVAANGDATVVYAVFLRHPIVVAVELAIEWLKRNYPCEITEIPLEVKRIKKDGARVPSGKPFLYIKGSHAALSMLETHFLQRIGESCVSAYNAYHCCRAAPTVPFLDMHARHATGTEMTVYCAFGAAIGSQAAQDDGAIGFIGSSTDLTAPFFGVGKKGTGTMPHALIGYFEAARHDLSAFPDLSENARVILEKYKNSTVAGVSEYVRLFPEESMVTALIDYNGAEVTDGLAVARWFFEDVRLQDQGKSLAMRLDTHGGRHLETLDWTASVETLKRWTHLDSPDEIYDAAKQGIDVDDLLQSGMSKDEFKSKFLFGSGVTAANIVHIRMALDSGGNPLFRQIKLIGSSGFDAMKCRIMSNLKVPLDMIGTGSFMAKKATDRNATADIVEYNGVPCVKAGREFLLLTHKDW